MSDRRRWCALWVSWAICIGVVLYVEGATVQSLFQQGASLLAYPLHPDTTLPGLVLLLSPWWLYRLRRHGLQATAEPVPSDVRLDLWETLFGTGVAVTSLLVTLWFGRPFWDLPPAYHDEFSYLFQAYTFLEGKLYFPSHGLPEFFDQMHVINDNGVFASRYFPGVGLFIAPFLAFGNPWLGYWLAGSLASVYLYLAARTFFSRAPALLAGLLVAVLPPVPVFGNLILSHQPTLLALAVSFWAFCRSLSDGRPRWAAISGTAWGYAFLCRPLTAVGFGAPLAVYGFLRLSRRLEPRFLGCWALAGLTPAMAAGGLQAAYNKAITGNYWETPYGFYLRTYTPSHGYGLYNVSRGQKYQNPKVLTHYDQWAVERGDLTPGKAVQLALVRATTVAQWTFGLVPSLWIVVAGCLAGPQRSWIFLLPALGVHAAYSLYAFEGIYGLSYVYESVPFWILFAATTAWHLVRDWLRHGCYAGPTWLAALIAAAWAPISSSGQASPWWWGGPYERARLVQQEILYAKSYYARFEGLLQRQVHPPALVFIRSDPNDRHRDLVYNHPSLAGPILRARDLGLRNMELIARYPHWEVWHYDARTGRLTKWRDRADHTGGKPPAN